MVRIPIKNKDSIPLDIPDKPGIYLFYDKNKEIIYVGKANSLKKRLYQYRTHSRKKNHRKMRRIIEVACGLDWQILGGPEEALLAENNIIQTKKPKLNVAGAWYFIYPSIIAEYSNQNLTVAYTTSPEEFLDKKDVVLYGTFRSRKITKEAWYAFRQLMDFAYHREPDKKTPFKDYQYTLSNCWRRVPERTTTDLEDFLVHGNLGLIEELMKNLLEKPDARANAQQIQESINSLKKFQSSEILPLAQTRTITKYPRTWIPQHTRDRLFIKAKNLG